MSYLPKGTPDGSGTLEVICGGMFSGKTEELLRRLRRAEIAKNRCLLFKPDIDNRYSETHVVSHAGNQAEAYVIHPTNGVTGEVINLVGTTEKPTTVAFDEAQFFLPHTLISLCDVLTDYGCRVIVTGLDLDSFGNPFGAMPQLLALADKVTKLNAVCTACGQAATRSYRLKGGDGQIFVGGSDQYEARCRPHWKP